MSNATLTTPVPNGFPRAVNVLLNVAHGIDHMFLLIFATARGSVSGREAAGMDIVIAAECA